MYLLQDLVIAIHLSQSVFESELVEWSRESIKVVAISSAGLSPRSNDFAGSLANL